MITTISDDWLIIVSDCLLSMANQPSASHFQRLKDLSAPVILLAISLLSELCSFSLNPAPCFKHLNQGVNF